MLLKEAESLPHEKVVVFFWKILTEKREEKLKNDDVFRFEGVVLEAAHQSVEVIFTRAFQRSFGLLREDEFLWFWFLNFFFELFHSVPQYLEDFCVDLKLIVDECLEYVSVPKNELWELLASKCSNHVKASSVKSGEETLRQRLIGESLRGWGLSWRLLDALFKAFFQLFFVCLCINDLDVCLGLLSMHPINDVFKVFIVRSVSQKDPIDVSCSWIFLVDCWELAIHWPSLVRVVITSFFYFQLRFYKFWLIPCKNVRRVKIEFWLFRRGPRSAPGSLLGATECRLLIRMNALSLWACLSHKSAAERPSSCTSGLRHLSWRDLLFTNLLQNWLRNLINRIEAPFLPLFWWDSSPGFDFFFLLCVEVCASKAWSLPSMPFSVSLGLSNLFLYLLLFPSALKLCSC